MAWPQPRSTGDDPSQLFEGRPEDAQLKTKITWEFIVLEELRIINRLIMEAGKDFRKQNIFTLKHSLDSWEQTLAPLILLPDNKKLADEANVGVADAFSNLSKDWTIENYFLAVGALVEKKGAIIKILANAGRYMPVYTHIQDKGKPAEILGIDEDESAD